MIKEAYRYFIRKWFNLFSFDTLKSNAETGSIRGEILADYNRLRDVKNRKYICNAPFRNIYFNIHGNAAPCWLTFKDSDSFPGKSMHDIWFGEKFTKIRENIKKYDLSGKCTVCNHYINNRNFVTPLARAYDNSYKE